MAFALSHDPRTFLAKSVDSVIYIAANILAPVVGLVLLPFAGIKAAYYALSQNYHYFRTKNEQGLALSDDLDANKFPRYLSRETQFMPTDLTRLQHEEKRLIISDKLWESIFQIKFLAKCLLPLAGLFWALASIIGTEMQDSVFEQIAIRHHMRQLKNP